MTTDGVSGTGSRPGPSESRRHELADLYELLQISPRASQDVIQAAYRTLARSYHPDVNVSAEAADRIRQVNAAYNVLSDPQRRARYDLDCLRARRFERLVHPSHTEPTLSSSSARRHRALPGRTPPPPSAPVVERFPMLNGPALLGVFVLAALVVILLVLFSAAIDGQADATSLFEGSRIELVRR